jgi:D-alanyl-D-alanine carboxypeptidase
MWKIKVTNKLALISIGMVLLVSAFFIYVAFARHLKAERSQNEAFQFETTPRHLKKNYFKDLALEAKAIYVYDVQTGKVLYEKNADVPLPLASITKTMTAIVASESGKQDTEITVDKNALDTYGESGLQEGEHWTLKNLLSLTLISSSNDGAAAIAEAFPSFVNKMNDKAHQLGLNTLSFNNPTGLDIDETGDAGGYGSAKDVAKLFAYATKAHPDVFEETKYSAKSFASDTQTLEAKNTNPILETVPNVFASKTGYTLLAGGNLGMVFDRGLNEPVIIVVLGSSYDGRFTDMLSLASATEQTYNESK